MKTHEIGSRLTANCRPLPLMLLCALVAGQTSAIGQAAEQELDSFFDAVEVKIINVDVVALDKVGNAVMDLEPEEFRVYEDGAEVAITNFYRAGEEAAILQASRVSEEQVDESEIDQGTATDPPLTMAVFVDNTSLVPGSRRVILNNLEKFLGAELRPQDRIVLLSYNGKLSVAQQPTASIAELLAAVEKISNSSATGVLRTVSYRNVLREISTDTGSGGGGGFSQDNTAAVASAALSAIRIYAEETHANTLRTLAGVREALSVLSALPGPKALIYAGAGMTQQPSAGLARYWEQRFSSASNVGANEFSRIRELEEFDASDAVEDLARTANTHRITLYTLNPLEAVSGMTSVEIQGLDAAGNRTLTPEMQSAEISNRAAVMNLMSGSTGGSSTTGSMGNLLQGIRRDFDSMYSIAYRPNSLAKESARRKIKVEVLRPGVELRYRHHYRETTTDERLVDRTRSALLLVGAPNPMGVAVEFGQPEQDEKGFANVPVMVKVPMSKLTLLPQGEAHEGRISLFIAARDEQGRMAPVTKQTLPLRIPNNDLYNALAQTGGYTFTLKLRAIGHTVVVTVYDEIGQTDSVAQAELVAPSFG